MIDDLKIIKKKYGENMMHLCRELFPTILETPGLLSKLMLDNFEPTRFLYNDIIESNNISDFKNYVYSLIDQNIEKTTITTKTPKELFEQIGYDLYECKTEQDIQSFKKYYKKGEQLCTFNGGRLKSCYVFFAVKKDIDDIKRENFKNPRREDDYGISVMSIQFTRGGVNTLSIKNRYNHTVPNCDSTFSNNLENIVPGLTESFEREYNLTINQNENNGFEIPGYIKANDGKYYKVNYEFNNICYCLNNIIIDNFEVKKYDKEKYIVLDYFILDLQNKKIFLYDQYLKDSFVDDIKDIDLMNVIKEKETGNKKIEITTKDRNEIIIEIDNANRIIGYQNKKIRKIGNSFLVLNSTLTKFASPLLTQIGDNFMHNNKALTSFKSPLLSKIGNNFLNNNKILKEFNAPLLLSVKNSFLTYNQELTSFRAPRLLQIGDYFLSTNEILSKFECPSIIEIGKSFLSDNKKLKNFSAPLLLKVGDFSLQSNNELVELNIPSIEQIGDRFLSSNQSLKKFESPKLKYIGDDFMFHNQSLISFNAPKLEYIGNSFMYQNKGLISFDAPKLEKVCHSFLYFNTGLRNFNASNIKQMGSAFLPNINLSNLDSENRQCLNKILQLEGTLGGSLYNSSIKRVNKLSIFLTILINKIINQLKIKKNEIGGSHIK